MVWFYIEPPPLCHADDLTASLCYKQVRNWMLPKEGSAQCIR
jgi:hypothetical protein